MRSEREMQVWLEERQALGAKTVVASLAGWGEVHDYWNGRSGDFDFVMRTMQIAADLGLELHQQIFLMKSTLPLLSGLIDKLDSLPGKVKHREIYPLFYLGHARLHEHERVTKDDLKNLPERITKLFYKQENWRSEREWIDIFRQEKEGATPGKVTLRLDLDETNLDQLESRSCNEIIADLKDRTRAAYAALPTRKELCEECGDAANRRLYMFHQDIERKWLDSYLTVHPIAFERKLTHLAQERM
ncbi:MAG TPA: hypothetical protein VGL27_18110 [Negativicutes bacterium]